MKPTSILITATVLVSGVLLQRQAYAQVPEKMSYQAVIRNSSDQLVTNTTIGMQISILQGSATGTAVYVETHTPATNVNGLVFIEIGGGTPAVGTFAGIDWPADSYFLKTETDPTGGTNYTITGTSQILSVPYALYAKTAGNTLWSQNGSNVYYNNGSVGIGTSTPARTLHLSSPTVSNELIMEVEDGSADFKKWCFVVNGGTGNPQNCNLRILNDAATASTIDLMSWLNNGNVGIGTNTPEYKFDIRSENLGANSGNNVKWLRLYGYGQNQDQLRITHSRFKAGDDWTSAQIKIQKTVDVTSFGYISFKSDYLEFGNGGTAQMRIFNDNTFFLGNLGGGLVPAGYTFYVCGSAYSTGGWTGSDARWKKNITPIGDILDNILLLEGVNYEWRNDEFPELGFDTGSQIGLIAQDVEKVFPELVKTDSNGYKAVSYEKLSVILVEGMKEQQKQFDDQQKQVEDQQKQIDDLKQLVNTLMQK